MGTTRDHHEGLGAALDRVIGHGPFHRGGRQVGCWWVDDAAPATRGPDGRLAPPTLRHRAVSTTSDGHPVGVRVVVPLGEDPRRALAASLHAAMDSRDARGTFGLNVRKALAVTDPRPPRVGEELMLAPDHALTLACRLHGRDLRDMHAHAMASARMDDLLGTLRGFLDTLDPDAVAVLRSMTFRTDASGWRDEDVGDLHDHRTARRVGRAWPLLDRGHGDAPLSVLLAAHPNLSDTLLGAADDDPEGFARDAATPALAGHLARRAHASIGLPRHLGRTLGDLDAAMRAPDSPATRDVVRHAWTNIQEASSDLRRIVDFDDATGLAWGLRDLPASWAPRDAGDWTSVLRAYEALRAMRGHGATPHAATYLGARGDWRAYAARLEAIAGDVPLRSAIADRLDLARALHAEVIAPAVAIARGFGPEASFPCLVAKRDLVADLLHSGRSLPRSLEVSAAWHRGAHRRMAAVAALPGTMALAIRWGPALPDHAAGDLTLRVLVDEVELSEEGGRGPDRDGVPGLGHCVGGYGDLCRRGVARVASVRRTLDGGGFERLATVEFGFADGLPHVRQVRGRDNGEPGEASEALVEAYVAAFASGASSVAAVDLAPLRTSSSVAQVARYDWTVPGNWEAVRDLWRRYLPRPLRDLTAGDWAATWDALERASGDPAWRPGGVVPRQAAVPGTRP